MLRILHNTKVDFIRLWRWSTAITALFIIPGIILIAVSGFRYSIEFTGGTLMQLEFQQPVDVSDVRSALSEAGIDGAEIQRFGTPREVVIRAQDEQHVAQQSVGAESIAQRIRNALTARYGADAYRVLRTEGVSPRVGAELRQQALIAILLSFAATLVYLAWRFEWRFGVAAILATLHDIAATLAFMRYMNLEISLFVVGAVLTVIGYSLNDTVVVFDRVRENLKLHRKMSLYDILNVSVNETLPRTVMTGSTTLATLLALLIFGGEVIRPFAWVLTFGILVGTFSSIFVAGPVLLYIERKWPRAAGEKGGVTRSQLEPTTESKRRAAEPVATR
ncbi:MAG TPA: protein translocase subunit SecF [Gemmatimonadaceae bacterium]|nr:protein translocase subunit SecF [Gemmatimonadaceae bacterium]